MGKRYRYEVGATVETALVPYHHPDWDCGEVVAVINADCVLVHWHLARETYREDAATLRVAAPRGLPERDREGAALEGWARGSAFSCAEHADRLDREGWTASAAAFRRVARDRLDLARRYREAAESRSAAA